MFTKLWAITHNTFIETVRQPLFGVLLWVAAGVIILNTALVGFTLESDGDLKMAKDVGLATLLLYGLLASVFSASSVIAREIESHTVLTVVSKPVSRPLFLLGKYLGVCGAVLVGYFFLCIVLMMTIRHGTMPTAADDYDQPVLLFGGLAVFLSLAASVFGNYVYNWHFPSTLTAWVVPTAALALIGVVFINKEWKLQSPATDFGDFQMIFALALAFFGVLVLTAFAVAFATRFGQVMTLIFCTGIYVVGLLSDYYLGQAAADNPGLLLDAAYRIVPNFQFFYAGAALTQEHPIIGSHVAEVGWYAVLYATAVLGVGVAMFQTREVS
jgi:ABC-2 type transport system permease protein